MLKLILALAAASSALAAADPFLGIWKLNVARSSFPGDAPKELTITWEAKEGALFVSAHGVAATGREIRYSYRPVYDGKEYKNPGAWPWDFVRNTQVDEHTRVDSFTKGGKPYGVEKRTVSGDGNAMRVESWFETSSGKAELIQVFERVR